MLLVPLHFQIPSDLFWCAAAMAVGALFPTGSQSRHGKSNQITYVWALISFPQSVSVSSHLAFIRTLNSCTHLVKLFLGLGKWQ